MNRLVMPLPDDRRVRRFAQLMVGLVLFGATAAMMVLAGLGLDPWDVFHQGLARSTGLQIGTWTIIVSVLVLVLWIPLPQRPGVGTLLNAALVGVVMNVVLGTFSPPHQLWARVLLLVGGVAGQGLATGLYIGAGLGPGPRDGLTTGIAARGYSIRVIRTGIEASVLAVGYLLGGTVGIGTLLFALTIGPIMHAVIPVFALDSSWRARTGVGSGELGLVAGGTEHDRLARDA